MGGANPETVFLDVPQVFITNTRAVLNGVTYSMANISSVRLVRVDADMGFALVPLAVGFLLALGAITASSATMLWLGIALLAFAVWLISRLRPNFVVVLVSASGEIHAYGSLHRVNAKMIVDAIANAIVARG